MGRRDLFYIAVIRPVMEYAEPVWHTVSLLRIIFGGNSFTISSCHSFCDLLIMSSLYDRRDKLSTDFFPTKFSKLQAVFITNTIPNTL